DDDSADDDTGDDDTGDDDTGDDDAAVDCSPIESDPDWKICGSTDTTCEAVFTDGAGCAAVCAAAGLVCSHTYENLDGSCGPDVRRAELSCDTPSGHGSDWCVCAPLACVPDCSGTVCGDDSCGGSCGFCRDGYACDDGACVRPAVNCSTYPYDTQALMDELTGFGQGTTGGNPANVYHVTNRNNSGDGSLRAALENTENYWIVFDVEGEFVFDFDDRIDIKSNKTVDGRGRDVRIIDARFNIVPGVTNVIFSDIDASLDDPADGDGDLFSLRGHGGASPGDYDTHHFWFHHMNLHLAGDGLIDVRGATQITISWNHIYNHTKVMLHTKDTDDNASPGMNITYHHNWFDTVTRRGPHFAYGKADFYNNWQYHWYEYGAASIDEAQFHSEKNIYEARPGAFCIIPCPDPSPHGGGNDFLVSKVALSNDWAQDQTHGYTRSVGDRLLNNAKVTVHQSQNVFWPGQFYAAIPEPSDDTLRTRLQNETGPRKDYCK
ncbi:hypothetical protein K8I61_20245, partial [bacterium]|nr:hypothetical protein [bacterium]